MHVVQGEIEVSLQNLAKIVLGSACFLLLRLRFALASVLLLSIMAASQTAMQVAPPVSTPYLSPATSCLAPIAARALLADSVLPTAGLSLDVCVQENRFPIGLNQTAPLPGAVPIISSDLPEAPSTSWNGPNSTHGTPDLMSKSNFVPPTLAMERNTNKRWHTLDSKFVLLNTLSAVAVLADIETTARVLEKQPKAFELNPLFGKHPTRARLYGIAVPLNAFSFYLSYQAKRIAPRRSVWAAGPKVSIVVHTAAAINNLIVGHR
jgi:hypothetical protein